MKVAVTAQDTDFKSPVDPHFARGRSFVIADTDSGAITVRNNVDLRQTRHLAGTQAAGALISLGVQAVITGQIGPKAFATLRRGGVRVYQASRGTVTEAIDSFNAGKLMELSNPNAQGHWPQFSET